MRDRSGSTTIPRSDSPARTEQLGPDVFTHLAAQGACIERLTSDSRRCAPGAAFFAYPGERGDGRLHIDDALQRGAAAVVWESAHFAWPGRWRVPNVAVQGLKAKTGWLASQFYGRPSEALWTCAVTGTNGKTSTTQWIAATLGARGVRTGLIGTLGSGFPGALEPATNTTPDALEVQRLLAHLRMQGARAVAMEVSSHGLAQSRVAGVAFDCALFTNLSHDHLDYHGTMEAYAAAKARLFEAPGLDTAVLNLDDVFGVQLARRLAGGNVRTMGYALSTASIVPGSVQAFVAARAIKATPNGMQVEVSSSFGEGRVVLNQLGRFNVANALGVLACLIAQGVPFAEGLDLLAGLPAVPGRMQALGGTGEPLVVVDYAHTPDALEKVLQALRPVAQARGGRLVAVFGAGGERDPSKRPMMGTAVSRYADRAFVTSDNPRSEPPAQIVRDIMKGFVEPAMAEVELDRARAVELAIRASMPADVILLAGKGHELYQEIGSVRRPYSDVETARALLSAQARDTARSAAGRAVGSERSEP